MNELKENRTQNTENLLKLVSENSTLPIVPMVDYEIVCEDYGRWLGSFGKAYVGEYAIFGERYYTDREEFKEDYYNQNADELNEQFNYEPLLIGHDVEKEKKNKENEKLLDEHLEKVADKHFTKAILVNIDLPDY